jgi:hypothetical protein
MDADERDALKDQLRAMVAGRGDGIDLDTPERWVIEGLKNPVSFFHQLEQLIPADAILYFEGSEIAPEVMQFYERNRACNAMSVVRDMIFPVPEMFHVALAPGVIEGLSELLDRHPLPACFFHVKAYREGKLLFAFHDAFDGSDLLLSESIPEERIREFATALGGTYRCEENVNKRDPEQLRRFLWALDNPEKLRINWPWWKKAFFFWKR